MDILQRVGHLLATAGVLLTSFLGHNNSNVTTSVIKSSPSVSVAPSTPEYTAQKSISYNGYSIEMTVAVPEDGGQISGNVAGDCDGKITGQYDGKDNGTIDGQANVICHLLFMEIPGKATFTGKVSKTNKKADLQVTFSADSFQKTAPVALLFN